MERQPRSTTPRPPFVRKPTQAPQAQVFGEYSDFSRVSGIPPRQAPPSASIQPRVSPRTSTQNKGVAHRRCTDVLCVAVLALFGYGFFHVARFVHENKDVRRLSRGFDHRGRLCGVAEGTEGKNNVTWCPHTGKGKTGKVDWDSPICVRECPTIGEKILCPEPEQVTTEETKLRDGRVRVDESRSFHLVPRNVSEPSAHLEYFDFCAPAGTQAGGLLSTALEAGGKRVTQVPIADLLPMAAGVLVKLPNAWRVILLCMAGALALNLFYLVCLWLFAGVLVHLALIGSVLVNLGSGLLLLGYSGAGVKLGVWDSTTDAEIAAALKEMLLQIGVTGPAELLQTLDLWLGGALPTIAGVAGGALLVVALLALALCVSVRRTLAVAVDCVRSSASALLFNMPGILYVAIVEAAACMALALVLVLGLPVVLSTVQVKPQTFGGVQGVYRVFDLGGTDLFRAAVWVFGCLWAEELVTAVGLFVTSYATATWYFRRGRRGWVSPVILGLLYAVIFHLGSLAFGACVAASLKAVRYFLLMVEALSCRKGSTRGRRCGICCAGSFQGILKFLHEMVKFVNRNAYVDIALTSEPYTTAASAASVLLARHAGAVTFFTSVCGFFYITSIVTLGAAGTMGAYALAVGELDLGWFWHFVEDPRINPVVKQQANLLAKELNDLNNPWAVAGAAGLSTVIVGRTVLTCVLGVAKTLLYCLLWDASDGTINAPHVPKSFRHFAEFQGMTWKTD